MVARQASFHVPFMTFLHTLKMTLILAGTFPLLPFTKFVNSVILCDFSKYLVRASYMQIYNEIISDLLKEDRRNLLIREDAKKGVFVHRLSEWVVRSSVQVYELMSRGAKQVLDIFIPQSHSFSEGNRDDTYE